MRPILLVATLAAFLGNPNPAPADPSDPETQAGQEAERRPEGPEGPSEPDDPEQDGPEAASPPPRDPAPKSREARIAASEAFAEGEAAFGEGRYLAAVKSFERAQRLLPHPNTQYNLALAHQAAGNLPEAWRTFGEVERGSQDRTIRADARARMSEIEKQLAVLFVVAQPEALVCLDGRSLARARPGRYEDVVVPGNHELSIDGHTIRTELYEGQTRTLFLEHADQIWTTQRPSRAVPALIGTSATAATLAAGLGIGAAASSRSRTPGLTTGAAVSALVAAGTGVGALVVSLRTPRQLEDTTAPDEDERPTACPNDRPPRD